MAANPVRLPSKFADAKEVIARARRSGLMPDPEYSVSEWADAHRVLPTNAAEPGPWRTSRVPYMREIMDALSPNNGIDEVVFMKPAQIGGSEAGNNWIGSIIDMGLGPTMIVQPTVSTAEAYSRERIATLIEESPQIRAKVPKPKGKNGTNNTAYKEFRGGYLVITGANSAAELSSRPIRNLMLDEVDRYPIDVDGQGDPEGLARKRTDTFLGTRKIFMASTPTVKGFSRIEQAYDNTDKRTYHVPCPHCDHKQILKWSQIQWVNEDPDTARYVCESCGVAIEEAAKNAMIAAGEWRASAPAVRGRVGYALNSLYSPWRRWAGVVRDFLEATKASRAGDVSKLKKWTNLELGETWEDQGDGTDTTQLAGRAEAYQLREIQQGALLLTAAVDVQMNRLEVGVIGWGRGEEAWAVDYHVINGDPAQAAVWDMLDEYLLTPIQTAGGKAQSIRACAVDSGGHHTQEVYRFCANKVRRHVFAIKGASTAGRPVLGKPSDVEVSHQGKKLKSGAQVWMVGTDTIKNLLFGRLRVGQPGPGFIHLSKDLPHTFFEQLTSEILVTKWRKGRPVREWVLKSGRRNEALDLMVYNVAAAHKLGIYKLQEIDWQRLEAAADKETPAPAPVPVQPTPAPVVEAKAQDVPAVKGQISALWKAKQMAMQRRGSFVRGF